MTDGWDAPEPVAADPTSVLAGRGRRLLGFLLEVVAWVGVPAILVALLEPDAYRTTEYTEYDENGNLIDPWAHAHAVGAGIAFACWAVLAVVTVVLLVRNGQNVSKWLLGMRMVRTDGAKVGFWRVVGLRFLAPLLAGSVVPFFGLVDACFIFRDDRRTLHDLMADTIVIRNVPVAIVPPAPPGWVRTVTCPSCGAINEAAATACAACGLSRSSVALPVEAAAWSATPTSPAPPAAGGAPDAPPAVAAEPATTPAEAGEAGPPTSA
jgi:uncharacterized RDD family membrane protein YckC